MRSLSSRTKIFPSPEEIRTALPRTHTTKLVETLFVHPCSRIEFPVKALGVERSAASRYLQSLEELGLLASREVGRKRFHVTLRLMTICPARPQPDKAAQLTPNLIVSTDFRHGVPEEHPALTGTTSDGYGEAHARMGQLFDPDADLRAGGNERPKSVGCQLVRRPGVASGDRRGGGSGKTGGLCRSGTRQLTMARPRVRTMRFARANRTVKTRIHRDCHKVEHGEVVGDRLVIVTYDHGYAAHLAIHRVSGSTDARSARTLYPQPAVGSTEPGRTGTPRVARGPSRVGDAEKPLDGRDSASTAV